MFAPVPDWLSMPFFYGSLVSHRLWFPVDPARVADRVPGFRPLVFAGEAWISLDLQAYTANASALLALTYEAELCLLGAPASAPPVTLSLADYLGGEDQTRTLGLYRLHVPCDNAFAIRAGIALFGEHKYAAGFRFELPSANRPGFRALRWALLDPAGGEVLDVAVAPGDEAATPCPVGAIVRYSHLDGALVGSRWDLHGEHHWLALAPAQARLTVGTGDLPIQADLPLLTRPARVLQRFESRPAAVEGRAFRV